METKRETKEYYVCGICGRKYDEKGDAEECEQRDKREQRIKKAKEQREKDGVDDIIEQMDSQIRWMNVFETSAEILMKTALFSVLLVAVALAMTLAALYVPWVWILACIAGGFVIAVFHTLSGE